MTNTYDLFEKFPDGSSLWRDSIPGSETTRLRLQEMARRSKNKFYAINLATGEVITLNSERNSHGVRAALKTERRSKSQVA
jgi:hypothetical protein